MDKYVKALRAYLVSTGVTQRALSAQLGVSQATISRWMAGNTFISLDNCERISRLIGLPGNESERCPLDNACPILNGGSIDYESAMLWQKWQGLNNRQRQAIIRNIDNFLNKNIVSH